VDEAEGALAATRPTRVYRRGCELVRVVEVDGVPTIRPLTKAATVDELARAAWWFRSTDEGPVGKKPPLDVAAALLDRGAWPRLRRLEAVVSAPTMRPDGTVLQGEPRYDEAAAVLYRPADAGAWPEVPDRPTKAQANAAVEALLDLVTDFPFVADSDRSAWLAALLTVAGDRLVGGARPMFVVRAAAPGTGKGLLVDVLALIGTGTRAPVMTQAGTPEEESKRLLALGREAAPLALIDNVERRLGSDVLAAALTSRTFKARLLGENRTASVPVPVLLATGNNVAVQGDLGRRVVPIDLQADVENPEERTGFKYPELLEHVARERPRLLVAALTVLRWFVTEGRPPADLRPFGSFEAWSAVVRDCLVYLGQPDPIAGRARIASEGDPQREADAYALELWAAQGWEPLRARELARRARDNNELADALAALHPRLKPDLEAHNFLSNALRRLKGRITNGLRVCRVSIRGHGHWSVERTA